MRALTLSLLVATTGCHVVATTAATTVATKVTDNLIGILVDAFGFEADFDVRWAEMEAQHRAMMSLAPGEVRNPEPRLPPQWPEPRRAPWDCTD